jgi:hypothetical protein
MMVIMVLVKILMMKIFLPSVVGMRKYSIRIPWSVE